LRYRVSGPTLANGKENEKGKTESTAKELNQYPNPVDASDLFLEGIAINSTRGSSQLPGM
jgi:hypothetical protein